MAPSLSVFFHLSINFVNNSQITKIIPKQQSYKWKKKNIALLLCIINHSCLKVRLCKLKFYKDRKALNQLGKSELYYQI